MHDRHLDEEQVVRKDKEIRTENERAWPELSNEKRLRNLKGFEFLELIAQLQKHV